MLGWGPSDQRAFMRPLLALAPCLARPAMWTMLANATTACRDLRAGFVYNYFWRALFYCFKHAWISDPGFGTVFGPSTPLCISPAIWSCRSLASPSPFDHDAIINLPIRRTGWHQMNLPLLFCYANITIKVRPGSTRPSGKRMWPGHSLWHPRAGQPYLADR